MAGAVVLFAAACNSQQASKQPTQTGPGGTASNQQSGQSAQTGNAQSNQQAANPSSASGQVDAAVNDLQSSVNSEAITNSQSDTDLLKADQAVVNDSNEVSNANY